MSRRQIITLNGEWYMTGENMDSPVKAMVPGSVYNDLLTNKRMPDPFVGDNEYKVRELMNYDYKYERQFECNPVNEKHFLVFEGIDTLSEITLNDTFIANTDNMHRTYRFDVTHLLKKGSNKITVLLKSPIKYIKEQDAACKYDLFQASDAIKGYVHLRKGSSMFGWDWGPQLPDAGIWKDVYIESISDAYLEDILVTQKHKEFSVDLSVNVGVFLINSKSKPLIEITVKDNDKKLLLTQCNSFEKTPFTVSIQNPLKWYPNGYGEQSLYTIETKLILEQEVIDFKSTRIGLREVKVMQEEDQYGESFTFNVNGINIFAKGSNYIPEDSILARVTYDHTKDLLASAVYANHNMVRVWGGGIYPPDYFYDICDELGLLVWQDLMFACSAYDMNNESFVETMKHEITDNLRRIRNHPSIALICGNNENEMAIEHWNVPNVELVKEFYVKHYLDILQNIVEEEYPNMTYWRSSPASKELFKNTNSDNYGDMHYWGVWHYNEPITYYRNYFPRFMSEFGLQSFPTLKTIETFAREEDMNIFSYVMEQHQKNKTSNSKILNYIGKMFKYPKNFEKLLYVSQVIQAEGIRYGAEHWRRNYGRCMGILYWQLNDCWPVASWSSIDYYHRWKVLHYHSKKFYQPILVSIEENKNQAKIFVTNDTLKQVSAVVEYQLMTLSGNVIAEESKHIDIEPQHSKLIYDLKFNFHHREKRNNVLYTKLSINNEVVSENTVSFVPDKHLRLRKPEISFSLKEVENGYEMILNSNTYAKFVEVQVKDMDVRLNDNYFNLIPNEDKKVIIYSNQSITKADVLINTLYDSY